jgi:antitoxin HicB
MLRYPVKIERDTNDTFLLTFPDIPEAATVGDTIDEALLNGVDALESMIMAKMDDKEVIPMPSKKKSLHSVTLPALSSSKVFLYNAMIKAGVSKSGLAKMLNCHAPQIERLLDLNHASRLDQIEKALEALGLALYLDVKAA